MEPLLEILSLAIADLRIFLGSLLLPSRYYQIFIMLGLFGIAHLVGRWAMPRLTEWMRGLEGMRTSQLRLLIVVTRRTRGIVFVLLAWSVYLFMQQYTWPSRSQLIGIVATLATAWIFVAIATRVIRNSALRSVVRWSAWAVVTVQVLGIDATVLVILDGIGIDFGAKRLSLLLVLKAGIVLAALFVFAHWASGLMRRQLETNKDISPSLQVLLEKIFRIVLYTIAVFIGLQAVGFDLTSLTVLSGAIGLGIGFGLQKVVSNLISGFILLMDKSIKPGDVISLGETFGWISELNARYVAVITRDGKEYLIPNEDLITQQVVNWTHSSDLVRLDIFFGVSYSSDPHAVRKLAREAVATVKRVVTAPAPVCHIVGFGDSSVDFILRFWIADPSGGLTNVRGDVYLALWDALKAAGVDIPFPQRDVRIVSGEAGKAID